MPAFNPEERVIIIAPIGNDAAAMAALLNERKIEAAICGTLTEACEKIADGAGALLLTEETFDLPGVPVLMERLKSQPAWSELPLIILTRGGESRFARLLDVAADAAGSITLLERPIGVATLLRSVEGALRSRHRQYEARDLLEAKATLAAIVQSSQDAIISTDLDGIITTWNPGAERLYGYRADEAVGQSINLIVPHDRLAEQATSLQCVRDGRSVEYYETVRRAKDGVHLDIGLSISPIVDAQGKVLGASRIARDVTARKHAEESLRESEDRFRSMADGTPVIIWVTDAEGRLQFINRAYEEFFGVTQEQVRIEGWQPLVHPEDAPVYVGAFCTAVREAQPYHAVARVRRSDGQWRWVESFGQPRLDAAGRCIGLAGSSPDITERRQLEEQLKQAQEELRRHAANLEKIVAERTADLRATNEQLETFVYSVAHDLRAPLRSMTGFSQLLLEDHAGSLDETGQNLVKRIQASSEFMDKLLLDLLAYGRAARAELELAPVAIRKAWDIALFQCATQIEQTGAQIGTVEPLGAVLAHEATLGQCLANLLNNAVKFVAQGVRPRVRCWCEERGNHIRVWLEDNGIGISARHHERVFRVFERLEGPRYAGTGIGLSIVRKGIERMGGQVGVESEAGKGSRFWIELTKASER